MDDYPKQIVTPGHIEPVPRRIRAVLGGEVVLDTTKALYVWEWPHYPQYYIPVGDVRPTVLVDEQRSQQLQFGTARQHGLRANQARTAPSRSRGTRPGRSTPGARATRASWATATR